MSKERDIFFNKNTDKTYVGPQVVKSYGEGTEVFKIRYVSKVIDADETQYFAKLKNEIVIRVSSGGRQEIKGIFYEDDRNKYRLIIQKFTKESHSPHQAYFSFSANETKRLYEFLKNLPIIPLRSESHFQITDDELKNILLSREQAEKVISDNFELISEMIKNDITKNDIVELGYRKKQLEIFYNLINDESYLKKYKEDNNFSGDEETWQSFFESNTWIFGYGLSYIFSSSLIDKKLEQVVSGFTFNESGKRIDALMKTKGIISSLCFVEIKTNYTQLLNSKPYRAECWKISDELSGAISQIQKTASKALKNIESKIEIKTKEGNPTGEIIYNYQPKSFIIIGNLKEFITEYGINEDKYSSFEIFRQSIANPEIITYDELYERAKFIVENS